MTACVGQKGMGKSTAARIIYRRRIEQGGSGIWIDRTGRNDDLGRTVETCAAFREQLARAVEQRRPFNLVVNLGWGEDHDPLWRIIYETGSCLVVLDDPRSMMNAQRIDPDLEELVELGRNQQVDLLATVRRPPELHGSFKAAADVALIFRQSSRHYAETCAREWLQELPGSVQDAADRIMHLPRFTYLRRDPSGAVGYGRVDVGPK